MTQNWADSVGRSAAQDLNGLGDAFEIAATEMRGAVMVFDGLAESIGMAQSMLHGAIDEAARSGLVIDAAGHVSRPAETLTTPGDNEVIPLVQRMIDEALREATQADDIAARAMGRVQNGTTVTIPDQAVNADQNADSRDQMAMLAGDAPPNGDPQLVRQWWQSLSLPQRDAYERAEPVVVAGLEGVPDAERQKMHEGTGYIDRNGFVGFALDHAYDTNFDDFENNCANFVSTSLRSAGMPESPSWKWDMPTGDQDFNQHLVLPAWDNADKLHQYLTSNEGGNGREVPLSDVQPGDVLFFETPAGKAGHTAVVTGVTPDGDIKYSQHTASAQNQSLDGRRLHWETGETANV